MSRAFVRESDDAPERPIGVRRSSPLPLGADNYITARGAQCLRDELTRLTALARPRPAEAEDQIRHIQDSLQTAVVAPTPVGPSDHVRFGATVTIRDHEGETSYRIVSVDESNPDRNWISWVSPVAKVLLNARVGQRLRFRNTELEIVRVCYD